MVNTILNVQRFRRSIKRAPREYKARRHFKYVLTDILNIRDGRCSCRAHDQACNGLQPGDAQGTRRERLRVQWGKIRALLAGSRQAPVFAGLATPDIAFEDGQNGRGAAIGIAVGGTDSRKVIVHFRHPSLG